MVVWSHQSFQIIIIIISLRRQHHSSFCTTLKENEDITKPQNKKNLPKNMTGGAEAVGKGSRTGLLRVPAFPSAGDISNKMMCGPVIPEVH